MPRQRNSGKPRMGVRELLAMVSLIAVMLGGCRLFLPIDNQADHSIGHRNGFIFMIF